MWKLAIFNVWIVLLSTGCSGSFSTVINDSNSDLAGDRTCQLETKYGVDSFEGFSYKTVSSCNEWHGQIRNDSDYTIRCINTINGAKANTIQASPRDKTKLEFIGPTSGRLKYHCMKWERGAFVWKDYHQRSYQVLLKVDSGKRYITVKNLSSSDRKCFIKDKSEQVLVQSVVGERQTLGWVRAPSGDFYTNCIFA
ncbi:hypothetical protein [uncultured Psychrobacter sp.]|uniref:hypothetical protein n=1 Tax=uncultured Psychrobacter sp. TaxID=259303 RepID=UPI00262291A6|nr:hypothetical protein [uncultured Psychrobacter sp.]